MTDPGSAGRLKRELVGDISGDFFVPSYQRGYRWGVDEVRRLLEDISQSGEKDYYLQPVVVKHKDLEWELIDGQQRLTTLFLILQYLKNAGLKATGAAYSIRYATREDSAAYLLNPDPDHIKSNIDFFHINQAYTTIAAWFDAKGSRREYAAGKFYTALFERVYVFWYEAPDDVDATALFTRLNIGRIPLTDAELVKALLLSRSRGGKGRSDQAHAIAAEWDSIERGLRFPEVWAFVTARADQDPTHIDLLLNTVADRELRKDGKPIPSDRHRPPFLTFETLRPRIDASAESAEAVWAEVADLFSLVQGWYDDLDLFHRIGYLVATGDSFAAIVDASDGLTKSGFETMLNVRIRDRLKLSGEDLAELSYEQKAGRTKISEALLLMNVQTVSAMTGSSERYSFRARAAGAWSLEHIHAQSAEQLTKAHQWSSWLTYHRAALSSLPGVDDAKRAELTEEIEAALTDVSVEKFHALETKLAPIFAPDGNTADEATHSIWNLALLGVRDNSALNNSAFEVKRRMILKLDRDGSYIPVCTRNIFLKYYSQEENVQLHFWSKSDREAYLRAIKDILTPYLLAPEPQPEPESVEAGT
jgi:hypothetical protein